MIPADSWIRLVLWLLVGGTTASGAALLPVNRLVAAEQQSSGKHADKKMDEDREANAQYMKDQLEAQGRLQRFREELKKATDPVALALPLAKDRFLFCARAAMDVLLDHWSDPRAEQALAELAQGEPKFLRDGLITAAGEAHLRLLKLRAKKEVQALLKGAKTPREQWLQIKALLEKNVDALPGKSADEKAAVHSQLLQSAKELGGAEAVPVLLQSGALPFGDPYLSQQSQGVFDYVSKLGAEKTLAGPAPLLNYLVASGNAGVGPLLEGWLKEVKDDQPLKELVARLASLPDGKQRLIRLLNDTRPIVVTKAASWLEHSHPSAESLQAVRDAIQRRRKAGATDKEIKYLEAVAKEIEEALKSKGK